MDQNIVNIKFPNVLGKLNGNHKSDFNVRLYRVKCSLTLLKKNDAYGAGGNYEYRIGGNNGQVDEDVVAAVVGNIEKIVFSTAKKEEEIGEENSSERFKRVHNAPKSLRDANMNIPAYGVSDVTFKYEDGDWYINFDFTGHLLEAEYVINVNRESGI